MERGCPARNKTMKRARRPRSNIFCAEQCLNGALPTIEEEHEKVPEKSGFRIDDTARNGG
jgi:hypothetical protein